MEKLMHYVWQHRLWLYQKFQTRQGQTVDIIDPGLLNNDAGPDFFNAKIKIGDQIWSGNIEIHSRASDWFRHGHQNDPAYHTVILHVVGQDDAEILRPDGTPIPQIVMPCAHDFRQRYLDLVQNPLADLPCAAEIAQFKPIHLADWIHSLAFERLQEKAHRIFKLAVDANGDWSHAIYIATARALGFGTNAEPMERLANAVPIRMLRKHADNEQAVEGLLFGMAGLLTDENVKTGGDYPAQMADEFRFLSAKYSLTPPPSLNWKMARMRPQNFPHRRIATLAALVEQGFVPGYALINAKTPDQARKLFQFELLGFWSRRYHFGQPTARSARALSENSINSILINVAAPAMYAYGNTYARDEMAQRAIDFLEQIPPEENNIVRLFQTAGIECPDAFTSQALIQLRKNYCNQRKCLYCRIGHRLLAAKVKP